MDLSKTIEIADTFFLDDAIKLYRNFWDKCWQGHSNKQTCNFDGTIKDLEMLDYCEYELGHPDESYRAASIIWANVILTNSNLIWGEKKAEVYLFSGENEYPSFEINVHKYVKGIIESDISQFESFSVLTEKLVIDMLMSGYDISNLRELQAIVYHYTYQHSESYSENFVYALSELYKQHPRYLKDLHEVLYGNV